MEWIGIETRGTSKTGTVAHTEEFGRMVRRRIAQQRMSRDALPEPETLAAIRRSRRIPQQAIARHLHTGQGDISKLERRLDARVSTLRAYVDALGGTLDLVARFPGRHCRITFGHP